MAGDTPTPDSLEEHPDSSPDEHRQERDTDDSAGGRSILETILAILGQVGEESVPVFVDAGVDLLFSDAVRTRLEQEVAEGLRDLLESAREALSDSVTGEQLGRELVQAEGQLQTLVGESIENLFSGQVRADFQRHMEEAAQELVTGNTEAAKGQAEDAIEALLAEILHTLQGHWGEILRLLLGIIAKALEEALAAQIKDAFASLTSLVGQDVEDKAEPLEEEFAGKLEELREHLIEARDTIHDRVDEAKEQLQDRLEDAGAKINGGRQRQSTLGHPPSRRPPPGPTARHGPRRAPRGLPPSASR